MPLQLNFFEQALRRLHLLPTPLFDMPINVGIAKVLVTACELDIFNLLATGGKTVEQLADVLNCLPQRLQLLLRILVSVGYLHLRGEKYQNTAESQRWLVSSSPTCLAPYILHGPDIVAIWEHIPQMLYSDQAVMPTPYAEHAATPAAKQLLARHYAGLAALATSLGQEVVQRIRLPPSATRLLDIGGSHAAYSAMFCRKYPHLSATIVDLPPGLDAGLQTAKRWCLEEHMHFVASDLVQDNFPAHFTTPFDVALYFQIAHLLQPEANLTVLEKISQTLRPGGMLIFVDQLPDQTHNSQLASLIVQFMTLTTTIIGGTCYPFTTIKSWLEQVGMRKIRRYRLLTPGTTLITAEKT